MSILSKQKKWRVFCIEEDGFQTLWSSSQPVECPNDPGHTINSEITGLMATEIPQIRIIPQNNKVGKSFFSNVASIYFDPSDYIGKLRRVVAVGYKDNGVTNYEIELFDATNNQQLLTSVQSNSENLPVDLGLVQNPPTTEVVLEINLKKTGGNARKYAVINEIIFYFESDNTP